jgi:hypothetical protein
MSPSGLLGCITALRAKPDEDIGLHLKLRSVFPGTAGVPPATFGKPDVVHWATSNSGIGNSKL